MYKVILVDDEIWALSGIRKIFKWDKYGFEVIGEYTSGEEALEAILNQKVDVVFTDIQMDNFSGIDLMKDVSKRKKIKFVVVSAFPKFEYAQSAMKYGACEYCIKPVSLERADVQGYSLIKSVMLDGTGLGSGKLCLFQIPFKIRLH